MGSVLRRGVNEGTWKRSDLVISTKIFWGPDGGPNDVGLSRKHIIEGTKASLRRLQLDYVDVLVGRCTLIFFCNNCIDAFSSTFHSLPIVLTRTPRWRKLCER